MRPYTPVVQGLLDDPLVLLAGVGAEMRTTGVGSAMRPPPSATPPAVQQELERRAQVVEGQPFVLHLNHHHVVVGIGEVHHLVQVAVPDQAGAEHRLAFLQQLDHLADSASVAIPLSPCLAENTRFRLPLRARQRFGWLFPPSWVSRTWLLISPAAKFAFQFPNTRFGLPAGLALSLELSFRAVNLSLTARSARSRWNS